MNGAQAWSGTAVADEASWGTGRCGRSISSDIRKVYTAGHPPPPLGSCGQIRLLFGLTEEG
jgi:hypothetical protein